MDGMTPAAMTAAFNEWMRRYTEEPERFEAEFRVVAEFLASEKQGKIPTYGEECAAYLQSLAAETAYRTTSDAEK